MQLYVVLYTHFPFVTGFLFHLWCSLHHVVSTSYQPMQPLMTAKSMSLVSFSICTQAQPTHRRLLSGCRWQANEATQSEAPATRRGAPSVWGSKFKFWGPGCRAWQTGFVEQQKCWLVAWPDAGRWVEGKKPKRPLFREASLRGWGPLQEKVTPGNHLLSDVPAMLFS